MPGPRDLSPAELERCGPNAIEGCPRAREAVRRIYCLHCGCQVSEDRREVDPDGWWACVRGCNTIYKAVARMPQARATV